MMVRSSNENHLVRLSWFCCPVCSACLLCLLPLSACHRCSSSVLHILILSIIHCLHATSLVYIGNASKSSIYISKGKRITISIRVDSNWSSSMLRSIAHYSIFSRRLPRAPQQWLFPILFGRAGQHRHQCSSTPPWQSASASECAATALARATGSP